RMARTFRCKNGSEGSGRLERTKKPSRGRWTSAVLSFASSICAVCFISFASSSSIVLGLIYYYGLVDPPPEGFRTSLSYVSNSLDAQNHSAISHFGSSLWSFGGLTH